MRTNNWMLQFSFPAASYRFVQMLLCTLSRHHVPFELIKWNVFCFISVVPSIAKRIMWHTNSIQRSSPHQQSMNECRRMSARQSKPNTVTAKFTVYTLCTLDENHNKNTGVCFRLMSHWIYVASECFEKESSFILIILEMKINLSDNGESRLRE